eukprot:gene10075-4498_t
MHPYGQPSVAYGANTVSEQVVDQDKMGVHTKARRSWDWVSYTIDDAGVIAVTPYSSGESDMWFNIQFAVVKSTLMMMGAHPLWAPANQTHILRSTSVVT